MNGATKIAITALASALASGSAVWATTIGRGATRADVSRMIQIESPYVQDRNMLRVRLDSIDSRLERIEAAIHANR